MIKLRWFSKSYRLTVEKVREYAEKHDVSMVEAKRQMQYPIFTTVLQQWDDDNCCWIDVPHEHEYLEVP